MKAEQETRFERTEMRMIRWMTGVSLREKKTSVELRARIGLKPVREVVRGNRLRWLGHVLRKDPGDWVQKFMDYEVEGKRPRGRPKKTWKDLVEKVVARGLSRGDAMDKEKWREASNAANSLPLRKQRTWPQNACVCVFLYFFLYFTLLNTFEFIT
jgi:hypothetical protein